MPIQSINPYNGELLKSFEELSDEKLVEKLALAEKQFLNYKKQPFVYKQSRLFALAKVLRKRKVELSTLISLEMGKLYRESEAEIEKCAWVCEYYAEVGESFLSTVDLGIGQSKVVYQPLGVLLGVMPWNFPFWQVFRFIAPALMAGNGIVLKHASNVPQCALKIEELLLEAGFEPGVFQTLLISSGKVKTVLENEIVKAVSLTGSEQAGSSVAKIAGENIKPSLLELGGVDPFIVCEGIQASAVIDNALKARFLNCGQSCIAAKRFIVHDSIYEDFLRLLQSRVEGFTNGDPFDETTTLGPMAREDLAEELEVQVQKSIEKGAKCLIGGKKLKNAFFAPTILAEIKKGSPAYNEELFGPVAIVFSFSGIEEAISLANDVPYGLGASVWSKDEKVINRCVEELEYGAVFVNQMVASDPRLPFGGVKKSGFGRELAREGILSFVNVKTVAIQ